ncbi:MAG: hypothetical protein MRY83_13355 [Flavobacteriales bacterium]|nr:hypothetical protein [Flavobacteriales bacterium]
MKKIFLLKCFVVFVLAVNSQSMETDHIRMYSEMEQHISRERINPEELGSYRSEMAPLVRDFMDLSNILLRKNLEQGVEEVAEKQLRNIFVSDSSRIYHPYLNISISDSSVTLDEYIEELKSKRLPRVHIRKTNSDSSLFVHSILGYEVGNKHEIYDFTQKITFQLVRTKKKFGEIYKEVWHLKIEEVGKPISIYDQN